MPRGRPRKAIIEPIAQSTKPIAQAPIVPIVTEQVTESIIEPSKDVGEIVGDIIENTQESDMMAEKGTAAQIMLAKATTELERLYSKREAIETAIEEKQSLRSTLQFQHQKSEAATGKRLTRSTS